MLIAFVGFWLTIQQLRQAQIALKAGNMYTIQKDARELIQQMMANRSFFNFIMNFDPKKKYAPQAIAEANRCLGVMFNFYLSVFRQFKIKGIGDDFAESMGRDFSGFISKEPVQAYYSKQREAHVYGKEHQEMVELWATSQLDNTRS